MIHFSLFSNYSAFCQLLIMGSLSETIEMIVFSILLSQALDTPFLLESILILSLFFKDSLIETHRFWIESLFFQNKIDLLGFLILLDIFLCSAFLFLTLYILDKTHCALWFWLFINLLTLKNVFEVLMSLYISKPSLRLLSCVVLTPWFIILRAGLETDGLLESWILCGSWCVLLVGLQIIGPVLLRWAFVPCEWGIGCKDEF